MFDESQEPYACMCEDCEQIIPETEWEMFEGLCEECFMINFDD